MKKLPALTYSSPTPLLLFLTLFSALAQGQQEPPPGPTTLHRSTFEDAHRFGVHQLVLDFAPGAWTPLHAHGGVGYVTVIEGEMTVRENDTETTYRPGETWVEHPGMFAEVGNAGEAEARILVTFLLPEDALLTTVHQTGSTEELPPGPTTAHRSVFDDVPAPGAFDLIQLVLEFDPSAWTPLHTHGGEGFVTVLEGEMTVRSEDGTETTYQPGETWVELPGNFAEVGNHFDAPASIAATFLLPNGEALTTTH